MFITLADEEPLVEYAKPIVNELRANMVSVEADFSANPIKAKIADAESARVHTMLVIGARDMEAGNVSVRFCTAKATSVLSRRAKSWRIFSRRLKSGGRNQGDPDA